MTGTPEHRAWKKMKERCTNPRARGYVNYGGRGITVCDEWFSDFSVFFGEVGPRPSAFHSLERLDVNGDYEPGNVVWATPKEQSRNKRTTAFVEYGGERRKLVELAEELGIGAGTLHRRAQRGTYGFHYVGG